MCLKVVFPFVKPVATKSAATSPVGVAFAKTALVGKATGKATTVEPSDAIEAFPHCTIKPFGNF